MSFYTRAEIELAKSQARKARAKADALEARANRMEEDSRSWLATTAHLFRGSDVRHGAELATSAAS
jgi:hypothetical protein